MWRIYNSPYWTAGVLHQSRRSQHGWLTLRLVWLLEICYSRPVESQCRPNSKMRIACVSIQEIQILLEDFYEIYTYRSSRYYEAKCGHLRTYFLTLISLYILLIEYLHSPLRSIYYSLRALNKTRSDHQILWSRVDNNMFKVTQRVIVFTCEYQKSYWCIFDIIASRGLNHYNQCHWCLDDIIGNVGCLF